MSATISPRAARLPAPLSLRRILFPPRGLSATEVLLAANLIVFAVLLVVWGESYPAVLRRHAADWWVAVHAKQAYGWFLATIFLHAGLGHLLANLTALLAASSAVEFLCGGPWAVAVYLTTGLGAAWASYAGHGAPPLSVGASGAIFGLLGSTLAFLLRRRRAFNYAQQWKVWRVYVPMFLLLFLPVLANADVHAHAGGFLCGLLLGPWLPPHRRIAALAAVDPFAEDGGGDEPAGRA